MSSGLVLDHIARWIRRVPSPELKTGVGGRADELAVDSVTGTLKFSTGNTTKEVADLSTAQTVTGAKTFTGAATFTGATAGVRRAVSVTDADTIAITAAMSGTVFIATKASATQVFTLPLAATAGLTYTFVCGHADSEIHVGVGAGDNIIGMVSADTGALGFITTTTTGLLKDTAASNVVGHAITLVSDGITSYYAIAMTGVWSAT